MTKNLPRKFFFLRNIIKKLKLSNTSNPTKGWCRFFGIFLEGLLLPSDFFSRGDGGGGGESALPKFSKNFQLTARWKIFPKILVSTAISRWLYPPPLLKESTSFPLLTALSSKCHNLFSGRPMLRLKKYMRQKFPPFPDRSSFFFSEFVCFPPFFVGFFF